MSREVITLFTGQAGTQVSNACWELFCLEHGIRPDGFLHPFLQPSNSHSVLFSLSQVHKFTPRTVIIDLEPTVINEIRTGTYKHLFDPRSLITGKEDAANNFAKGYYTTGREILDITLDHVRVMCERCSNLSGFIISRSCGGGTGSGFTALLLKHLSDYYEKKVKFDFAIHTGPHISNTIVEPYNSVLTTYYTKDIEDCCFIIDNEALYNICASKLDVPDPTYTNLNRLQAQVLSNITASTRFGATLHVSLQDLRTNLILFPKMHFSLISYAPIATHRQAMYSDMSVRQITSECFTPANQMATCDLSKNLYIGCYLLYRGDVNSGEVNEIIKSLVMDKTKEFIPWIKKSFEKGIVSQPAVTLPGGDLSNSRRTVTLLKSTTAIKNLWTNMLTSKYDLLCHKKAFFHHYTEEGMEEDAFKEARNGIADIIATYDEAV